MIEREWVLWVQITVNIIISVGAFVATTRLIPKLKDMFLKANLFGIDVNKNTRDKM